jgi:2,4'-dihydroxyacetophenone dioxygenase
MSATNIAEPRQSALAHWPAHLTAADDTPWVPLGPGRAFKPIRFQRNDAGYVALMRVDPGIAIPLHRHTGSIHAYGIAGTRRLGSGEIVGPGDYVFEPVGNTDTWATEGDDAVVVLIIVSGAVEYLADDGSVSARYSAKTQETVYRNYCQEIGIQPLDLVD